MDIGPGEVFDQARLGVWAKIWMLLSCFHNWPTVTTRLAVSRLLGRPPNGRSLSLRTRAGPVLTVPPGDGSWCTVVEVFGKDGYRLGDLHPDANAPVFVDIGANIGSFALDVCARWPDARVVCLEPAPGAFAHLVSNLEANRCSNRVNAVAAAVTGDSELSTVWLFECPSASDTSTTVETFARRRADSLDGQRGQPGHWIRVPAVSLDDVIVGVEGVVECLKLDVEGAEYDIIAGTRLESLRQLRQVVVEYHPVPNRAVAELVERFAQVSLSWTRWERSPEPGRGVCWFAAAKGEP